MSTHDAVIPQGTNLKIKNITFPYIAHKTCIERNWLEKQSKSFTTAAGV